MPDSKGQKVPSNPDDAETKPETPPDPAFIKALEEFFERAKKLPDLDDPKVAEQIERELKGE